MKKVIGQTVRDLKREVNKKVLKVPGIEQKVLDATNNEAWGPHGSLLAQLAQASRNYHEYQMIMNVIWKRINDTGKNWRHVYKALTVLEYLVAYGSERVIEEIREHAYQISTLSNFQYIDSNGRDQGSNVRRKSQSLVALVNDKERVQEVRQKASANKDKYHSEGRHGYKDDDRNENEKNDDRHTRGRNSYDRDGDRNGRDNEEQNERDGYRNDDYGGRGSVEYQQGSRRSVDRYTDHCVDDDDRYSSRSGGGRGDDHPHNERRLEQHLSQENVCAPPTYEEATRVAQNHTQNEMDGEAGALPTDGLSSHAAPKATSPTGSVGQGPDHVVSSESPEGARKEFNGFDEFDPRGPVSAAPPSATSSELDFFGSLSPSESTNSMALIPSPSHTTTTNSEAAMPINSGFGLDFGAPSAAFTTNENPFGEDSPFKAFPQENFQSHPQSFPPSEPFPPVAPNAGHVPGFDFGDMLGGLSYTTNSEMPAAQAVSDVLDGILPRTDSATVVSPQGAQHADPTEPQGPQMNFPSHSGFSDMFPQQAGPNNMESAHLSFLQQQGVPQSASFPEQTAPVPPQATQPAIPYNMPPDHLNFLQQQGVSQSAPLPLQVAQPASANSMPPSHLDFHQPQGAPLSAPFPTQATQPAPPNNMQPAHLNFLQQQGASVSAPLSVQAGQPAPPNNMQPPQMNYLQQQGALVSAPVSSQAAQPAPPNNMQPPQMNYLQQQGASVSAPVSSQAAQPAPPNNMQPPQMNLLQQPGGSTSASLPPAQPAPPNNMQLDHFNMFQQPPPAPQAAPAFSFEQPAKSQPTKFEPKSRVWADTLNRGLVDLNISGPKTNPLSDIGIDFDAINRKEKRKEAKSSAAPVASTITMGKAMGAGSGVGRAGASGLAPAPNPMMGSGTGMGGMGGGGGGHMAMGGGMGMGGGGSGGAHMGMGGGMGMGMGGGAHMGMGGGMGMGGYGGGMNQPSMGMNTGMVQGAQMGMPNGMPPPGSGMPGMGYNPMMGMGNYGPPQQTYGGGPPQQPYGGGPPQQPYGGGPPQQPYGGGPPQQPYGGGPPQQQYGGGPPQQPYGGGYR